MSPYKCPYSQATIDLYFSFSRKKDKLTVEEVDGYVKAGANLSGGLCWSGNLLKCAMMWKVKPAIIKYLLEQGVKDTKELCVHEIDAIKNKSWFIISPSLYGDVKTHMIIWYYYMMNDDTILYNIKKMMYGETDIVLYCSTVKREISDESMNRFDEYAKVMGYPIFTEFKSFAETQFELPPNLENDDDIPEWNPYED